MTQTAEPEVVSSPNGQQPQSQLSLGTAAARNLATTTKTPPQMQGITSRWLLRILPWIQVDGGVYRVNRRLSHEIGDGRVSFSNIGDQVQIVAPTLAELPALRALADNPTLLETLATHFTQHTFQPGDIIAERGAAANQLILVAHGKINTISPGKYGTDTTTATLADGDYCGEDALTAPDTTWPHTIKALTPTTTLHLTRDALTQLTGQHPELADALTQHANRDTRHTNKHGEASIHLSSGHTGEPLITGTFVDYELAPREYELSLAQTILRIHTRVADLYNKPHNQTEQQLKLTIHALRERQEHELVNNTNFGLLHNADLKQRIPTRSGPPTPDDLDELLALVWKEPSYLLAHPKTIAAFGRECTKRGIYPQSVDMGGNKIPAWRGIPLLPCSKIPVTDGHTSSILCMRVGEETRGVIGLQHTGLPDEYEPGLSVRFMNINEQAVISYLVSTYYSAAILVPDALGILEQVELGRGDD
ncbi:MAG TPA: family 2B encapsulin nanocompartment shell protein [Pseudonocardiaceae bacterium]|nr:family 2B encapsulin nanocompartment shell protein [Pseudonocardiaceae bacterium]